MNLGLTRWDPFLRTSLRESGMPALFRELFRNFPSWDENEGLMSSAWMPPVDIAEDADRISVTAELPGFKEEDVRIELQGDVLTISGERKRESEKNDRDYRRVERSYGEFRRSFTLPSSVDREKVKASFSDGLLRLELPKKPEAKPRRIPITAGKKEPETAS